MHKLKLITSLLLMTLFIALTSCGSFRAEMMSTDYDKIADTRFNEIIDALNSKDSEALKSVFSTNALKEAKDIDNGIEYLMDFYKGEIIDKEVALDNEGANDYGKKTNTLRCLYTVTTNEDVYLVFFIDELVDTENPDNEGIYMLQIIKEADRSKYFDWGDKTKCAGIYQPTENTSESLTDSNK